ncbi:hypothetical protein [Sphingomonas abaci]|uniref:Uncharacterized protein n=1 Tax=Sphingomonas abaci TaxID=237611 RepID=A0A7W7F111_9SPHN|nr:hypothetical protein [Sphingomonas abaci]MBB4618920.1 hypothetical protein [Sphingomonas abaci]
MIPAFFLALQAAPNVPQRFSILADDCSSQTLSTDQIVVCGRNGSPLPRLPLPDERPPPDIPRQRTGDPRAGLENAQNGACAFQGCQVGVMLPIIPVAKAGIAAIRRALAPRIDTSERVAIDLDSPPPPLEGRLSP